MLKQLRGRKGGRQHGSIDVDNLKTGTAPDNLKEADIV